MSGFILLLLLTSLAAASEHDADDDKDTALQIVTTPSDDDGYITPNSPLVSPNDESVTFFDDSEDEQLDFNGLSVWIFNKTLVDFNPALSDYFTHNVISLTTNQDFKDLVKVMKGYGRQQSKGGNSFSFGLYSPQRSGTRFELNLNEAPDTSSSPMRTPLQELQLGRANCGKNVHGFRQFARKHIIRLTLANWNPDHLSSLAFYYAPAKRGHEPVSTATFFFLPATELLDYSLLENEVYGDVCNTTDTFDTFTCYRFKNEDGFSGCISAGKCSPNYQKSTGKNFL